MEKSEQEKRVEKYLNKIQFKKRAVGGVDEEDVLEKIEELCRLIHEHYRAEMDKAGVISSDEFDAAKNEAQALRNEAQTLRNEAQMLRSEAQTLRDEAQPLRDEAQRLKSENKGLSEELRATRERLKTAQAELDRLREGGSFNTDLLEEKQAELDRLRAELERERSKGGDSGSLRAELERERKLRADLKAENDMLKRQSQDWGIDPYATSSQEAERQRQESDQKYRELVSALGTVRDMRQEAARAKAEAIREATKVRDKIMEKTREERRRAEIGIQQLQSEIVVLQRKKQELQEMVDAQQGVLTQSVDSIILRLREIREQADSRIDTVPLSDITDEPI